MISAITNGIKVSVNTAYEGRFVNAKGSLYLFSYDIVIDNHSPDTVQLLGRHWTIYDIGFDPSEVTGAGVVGKKPILSPGESHSYQSGCHLINSMGTMRGTYKMIRLSTGDLFDVEVPQLDFFASEHFN